MRKSLMIAILIATFATPTAAQELRIAVATHIKNFDPQDQTGNNGAPMLYQVFDTLVERDPFAKPLKFKPGLATQWKQVQPTVWEVTLRGNVKMHDGTIMNAEDVEFSLDRMFHHKDPEFFSAWGRFFYNFKDVEVVGPLKIRIHTHRPEPLFETLISARQAGITSKEHYEAHGFAEGALKPVGTGPYQVVEFVPKDKAVLKRFDGFWGQAPPFEKITFQLVEEVASRVTGLVNGEFDLITNIPPDQESALDKKGIKTMGVTWPMFHVWIIDQTDEVTGDARVRKAMRLCTDRQALVDGLWGGKGHLPVAHQFEEYGEPFYMPDLKLIKYDPAKAKRLLAAAGYTGEPIVAQFTKSYYLYGDLAAQVIQQQWKKCGLNLELQQIEKYDYKKLDIRAWSNPMYYPDPMGAMDTHWSKNSWTYSRNLWAPSHPKWNETYETARYGASVADRKAAYRKLLDLAEEESGWILLYEPYEVYGMREGISFEIPVAMRPYVLPLRAGQIAVN
jgi:peptide/nickel transport system substrate-binding protein